VKGFYSPIDRLMEQSTRPKGTGAEYMTELSKQPGFKQAEVEDRDLQTLQALPKMAREQFMAHLKAKPAVMPKTKVLHDNGDDDMESLSREEQEVAREEDAAHKKHTLPGGTNYREILLQHPNGQFPGVEAHFNGQPNILASIRAKDRVGPNGEKILHLEEIQSDWHQRGREKGYQPKGVDLAKETAKAKQQHTLLSMKLKEARDSSDAIDRNLAGNEPIYQNPEVRARQEAARIGHNNAIMDLMPQVMRAQTAHRVAQETARNAVPEAPFKKNWHELALKRMIQHAVENGYDQIHITPGQAQADRYGLSKHVGMVSYNPEEQHFQAFKPNRETLISEKGASPERVSDLIGSAATKRLMAAPAQMGHHYLEGEDLNVGGEGMKGFYDKMVPKFLNQFGKKYGSQVQSGSVPIISTPAEHHGLTENQFQAQSPEEQQRMVRQHAYAHQGAKTEVPTHRFDITPQMREDVLKNGMPLYSGGGEVDREEGLRKFLEPSAEKRRMYHGTRHYTRGVKGGHESTSPEADPNYTENMRNTGGFKSVTPGIRGMSFVTPDTEFANEYAGENKQADKMSAAVYPVHVQVKHPFDYENPAHVRAVAKLLKPTDNKWAMHYGKSPEQILNRLSSGAWEYIEDPDVQAAAKKLGHDAMYMNEHGIKNLGVFNPNVIKSATGNRGTYDVNDPHMNHAKGGVVSRETIKPVAHGIIKERVTVSPNMDAMRYELMSAKHFTKKVK